MPERNAIMTTFHEDDGSAWTERLRCVTRDEAIREGQTRLDEDKTIWQFSVLSPEYGEGGLIRWLTYRETAWRPRR